MGFRTLLKDFMPPGIQQRLRGSRIWTTLQARRLAAGSKRIDLCAAQMAQLLSLADIDSLEGKTCLELGSGWVLSHAVVLHLLGADRVYATDLSPIARLGSTRRALELAQASLIRDQLAPFSSHGAIRQRLKRLLSLGEWNESNLASLGMVYRAPLDFVVGPFQEPVDFIFSNSVLEHLTVRQASGILHNLVSSLRPAGFMVHAVHLEDHRDFEHRPFAFYAIPAAEYSEFDQAIRGNRLRQSGWQRVCADLAHTESRLLYSWQRHDCPLPPVIDASIQFSDEDDLRTSHMGLFCRRLA